MTIFLSAVLKIIFDVEKIIQNIFKKYTTGGTWEKIAVATRLLFQHIKHTILYLCT